MNEYRIVLRDYPQQCFLLGLLLSALFFIGPVGIACWNKPDDCKSVAVQFNEVVYK